jgi:hypothetical protein
MAWVILTTKWPFSPVADIGCFLQEFYFVGSGKIRSLRGENRYESYFTFAKFAEFGIGRRRGWIAKRLTESIR